MPVRSDWVELNLECYISGKQSHYYRIDSGSQHGTPATQQSNELSEPLNNQDGISPVGNELAGRAPIGFVLKNWRLWYFGILFALAPLLLGAAGVYLSLSFSDWSFMSRFGALQVIFGSYLIGRPIWRRRFKSRFVTVTMVSGGKLMQEQLAEYIMERTDVWFFHIGFSLAAIGSVIW